MPLGGFVNTMSKSWTPRITAPPFYKFIYLRKIDCDLDHQVINLFIKQ